MTNTIAVGLAFLIAGFFALDYYLLRMDAAVIMMRYLIDAIRYLAFWR